MILRDRCKELVREIRKDAETYYASFASPKAALVCADRLQAALDATEGEALDAARYRWLRDESSCLDDRVPCVADGTPGDVPVLFGSGLDAAIDQAMKESKP